ncbi:MAG: phosphoribosylaminoimidazolesuccinocarboxamide synthase [Oscillospiraceae bacterium]|nr:phosphoribosylaminoimidazolesuccinocarboxamide synthase [Oscillospiraceae bacterium]
MIYEGKTKDVYDNGDGNYLLKFKDNATGTDGVFDPGANTVGLQIEGMGKVGIRLTEFFFNKLAQAGIPTHFVSADAARSEMVVKPAEVFGKGLEIICRYKATGSFVRRYGLYCSDGFPLDAYVEVTLKDDGRNDPLITKDGLAALHILTLDEYTILEELTRKSCAIIKDELSKFGLELIDIKLEFGRCNGQITLIDEISAGNMRAYKEGKLIGPLELAKLVLGAAG